ncbi:PIG-L family deacetylase [Streptomyces sp. NPDC048279]|uniref:PIG-L family deacetylase n=1 Tax=Streptomyces sp. NPDC048279 TaxID=3154714 RepID=UPI003444EFE5
MAGTGTGYGLPDGIRRVFAVVAHPDDESFGLGGLLALLSDTGVPTAVLCFTHSEMSTLHGRPGDLRTVRADELAGAARELGVARVELSGTDWTSGRRAARHPGAPPRRGRVSPHRRAAPSHLLVFDTVGFTGHPNSSATGSI